MVVRRLPQWTCESQNCRHQQQIPLFPYVCSRLSVRASHNRWYLLLSYIITKVVPKEKEDADRCEIVSKDLHTWVATNFRRYYTVFCVQYGSSWRFSPQTRENQISLLSLSGRENLFLVGRTMVFPSSQHIDENIGRRADSFRLVVVVATCKEERAFPLCLTVTRTNLGSRGEVFGAIWLFYP